MPKRPCGRPIPTAWEHTVSCSYERLPGRQMCAWHALMRLPAHEQVEAATARRENQLGHDYAVYQARVPKVLWPEGERWCAGCQSFVPLFYTTGSRCKACASAAAHSSRVGRVYGISGEDYEALFEYQNGRCYICQREPRSKRLAVDHDHDTGEVRGLLCPDNERGCNMAVLGGLSTAHDGALAAARRAVEYLEDPPWARLRRERLRPSNGSVEPRPDAALPGWMR